MAQPERKHNRVALSVICGSDCDGENFEKVKTLLKSADLYFDGIHIAYNGDRYDEFIGGIDSLQIAVPVYTERFTWEQDFALARNQAFGLIPKDEYDWIFWADSDDTFKNLDKLDDLLDSLQEQTQGVMLRYDYGTDKKSGLASAVQHRERIFRTDLRGGWVFPIHEVYRTPAGTQIARRVDEDDVAVVHHKDDAFQDGEDDGTRKRNRDIIINALNKDPEDSRLLFYFAHEVYAEAAMGAMEEGITKGELDALCDAAIVAYENFVTQAPSPDEAYIATHQIAEIYKMKQDYLGSIEADLQAMMIQNTWPDAWVGIAQSYMGLGQYDKAIFFANAAIELAEEPETSLLREPLNMEYLPKSILATSYEQIGDFDNALKYYSDLADISDDERLLEKIEEVTEKKNIVNSRTEIEVVESLRDKNYGTQKDKSIAFFCRPSAEDWSSKSMKEGGIGGTETAVCEIAKRFADAGWRTVIFASPPEEIKNTIYDGIEWYTSMDVSMTEPFTIFVSVRTPEIFDANIPAQTKILWMHDVNTGDNFVDDFGNNRADNIDYIAGVSNWHCSHMQKLYNIPEEKLVTFPNGINLERFLGKDVERQKNKFIWSSSPDRGLDVVLDMWPMIRKMLPGAELHVFYGWNNYDKVVEWTNDPYMKLFKKGVIDRVKALENEKGGVYMRGRVDQDTLAEEFLSAEYLPYFGYFLETNCITALEAQAAGCVPFITNIGGAPENISSAGVVLDGFPNNFTYREQAMKALKEIATRTPKEKEEDEETMKDFVKTKAWNDCFSYWLWVIAAEKANNKLEKVA